MFLAGFWARVPVLPPAELGAWTRDRLAALGPVFVKLGQLLSTRPIPPLPKEFYAELRPLQSQLQGEALTDEQTAAIRQMSGLTVDPAPFKVASVAQVHLATFRGRRAVLKLRRAGVQAAFARDLGILRAIPGLGRQWRETVEELASVTTQELDFRREAQCLQFARTTYNASPEAGVVIPEPLAALPNGDGLVMSYEPGASVYKWKRDPEAAQQLLNSYLLLVQTKRCFHADPHAGNIALKDAQVVWYDLGAITPLPEDFDGLLQDLAAPVIAKEPAGIYEAMIVHGALIPTPGSRRTFVRFWGLINDPAADAQQLEECARNLRFQPIYLALGRSVFSVQGTCQTLDPAFRLEQGLGNFLQKYLTAAPVRDRFERAASRWDRAITRIEYVQQLVEDNDGEERQPQAGVVPALLGACALELIHTLTRM